MIKGSTHVAEDERKSKKKEYLTEWHTQTTNDKNKDSDDILNEYTNSQVMGVHSKPVEQDK